MDEKLRQLTLTTFDLSQIENSRSQFTQDARQICLAILAEQRPVSNTIGQTQNFLKQYFKSDSSLDDAIDFVALLIALMSEFRTAQIKKQSFRTTHDLYVLYNLQFCKCEDYQTALDRLINSIFHDAHHYPKLVISLKQSILDQTSSLEWY
jgi:hypothetical protein